MKRIYTPEGVIIKIHHRDDLSSQDWISLSGASQKRLIQVANHHLPLRRIRKMLIARGEWPMSEVNSYIESLATKNGKMTCWGDCVQLWVNVQRWYL